MLKTGLDTQGKFIIEDYNRKYPFANFLPAISGLWGIPLWVFFVNRGQGVISMGVKDKNHAILEFLPANRAYQSTSLLGFRTFVKINGREVVEPFRLRSTSSQKQRMIITSHDVSFEEENRSSGLGFGVNYCTLPNMPFGALIRTLTVTNRSSRAMNLDILDGVPKIIPFGSRDIFLKYLSRTLEAWMTADIRKIRGRETGLFKLFVDPEDAASTQHVEGVNFALSFFSRGKDTVSSKMIVDPALIFAEDTSFDLPVNFFDRDFSVSGRQAMCGKTPCSFGFSRIKLAAGKEAVIYTLMGSMLHADLLGSNLKQVSPRFIESKKEENRKLVDDLKQNSLCVSNSYCFNEYIQCSYLDNILRGGYPYTSPHKKSYYIYSRKHGDLERDYNKFKFLPSYFSQGESNYRDINQNRRMDVLFTPSIADKNIISFMNLLRLDGYNPLLVQGEKYYFENDSAIKRVLEKARLPQDKDVMAMMENGFYLGEIFGLLERKGIKVNQREKAVHLFMEEALLEPQAEHGEGFWIDHWLYNLDLIENFLYFYPDKKKELFFDTEFMFWDDEYRVAKRSRRYCLQNGTPHQLNAVYEVPEKKKLIDVRTRFKNFVRCQNGKGDIYTGIFMEKMLSLVLNKLTTLDFEGRGIEMEAGKPGWCDSLNGLPALFGSSLCETFALKRLIVMLSEALKEEKAPSGISLCQELYVFFCEVEKLLAGFRKSSSADKDMRYWDESNTLKENFRDSVFWGVSGEKQRLSCSRLKDFLDLAGAKLDYGIARSRDKKSGVYLTYFRHDIEKYDIDASGALLPRKVKAIPLPLFLEGPVHALRLAGNKGLHDKVKKSELFDRKLKMYRLNTCLADTPMEIGRSRAFPRGWLENESIWLHMEYKYLLELLKNDMYEEFYKNFHNCGICFQDPERYGRSILENSSFLASSVYPDKALWGKGFVARLTGATSEILSIWSLMCLGKAPFFVDDREDICLRFAPFLKSELFTKVPHKVDMNGALRSFPANVFAFRLFSRTLVVYHNPHRQDTYARGVKTVKIEVLARGRKTVFKKEFLSSEIVSKLREGRIDEIHVYFA